MVQQDEVMAIAGCGLEGDRYTEGRGAFSNTRVEIRRHVTLIDAQALVDAAVDAEREGNEPFYPHETRRNIVTMHVDLNSMVGKTFFVGEVELRGVELCDPCERPSKLAGKKGFKKYFENRGGLRAEIQSDGLISTGMPVIIPAGV